MTATIKSKKITSTDKGHHLDDYFFNQEKSRKFKEKNHMVMKKAKNIKNNVKIISDSKKCCWEIKDGKRKTLFKIILNFGEKLAFSIYNQNKNIWIESEDSSPESFQLALEEAKNA